MSKILKISDAAAIGFHSMGLIAKSETPLNANKIAEITGFSKNHIAKVLQQLARNNFLSSGRGPKGGYTLNKPKDEIRLLDIYTLIEGEISTSYCLHNKENCPFGTCILDGVDKKITEEFKAYLTNKKLSDL